MKKSKELTINWEAVYWEQMPRIYNFFRYRCYDDALAEDLTAMTFERAWKHRESYRSDLSAFSTWLFTIARNLATDHFRKLRDVIPLETIINIGSGRPVEEHIQRDNEFARLSALLSQLSSKEQELIALKYGAEMTNRAIADVTGLSESNVGTTLHRIVQRLRHEWEVELT